MFTNEQNSELKSKLNPRHILTREQGGVQLSYLAAHHVIRRANEIFGFEGWTRETLDLAQLGSFETKVGRQKRDGWCVFYRAKVRVIVDGVVREGCGYGEGTFTHLGQAHESAMKEAETDAMKRALMTFGDQFGLALYDKEKAHVEDPRQAERRKAAEQWSDNFIKSLEGLTFDEILGRMRDEKTARLLGRLPEDLSKRVDEAVKALSEANESDAAQGEATVKKFGKAEGHGA